MIPSVFKTREKRREAFNQADIYPVLSSEFTMGRPVADIFASAVRGGARIVQLREKRNNKKFLYDLAVSCRLAANEFGVLLIVDDHVDVALAACADGVHLGREDLPIAAARSIAPELLIGGSTHNLNEALSAQSEDADYINIGPIYPTSTKQVQCGNIGTAAIREIASRVNLPFTVMGGIKTRHVAELCAAGARRIAMITEITTAADVEQKVRELRGLILENRP